MQASLSALEHSERMCLHVTRMHCGKDCDFELFAFLHILRNLRMRTTLSEKCEHLELRVSQHAQSWCELKHVLSLEIGHVLVW